VLVRFDQIEEFFLRTAHGCALPAPRFSELTALAADFRWVLEQTSISCDADPSGGAVNLESYFDLEEREWRVTAIKLSPEGDGSMAFSLWYSAGELRLHLGAMGVMQGAAIRLRSGRYVFRSEAIGPYDCTRAQALDELVGAINLYLSPDFGDIKDL
jgi:hypothetical protein